MERYVVLDTTQPHQEGESAEGHQGRVLGSFASQDSAKAVALRRMAQGDLGTVVIDRVDGKRVFPRSEPPPRA
jgi:hypothetical protein